jgi:hypothetical protein
LNPPVKSKEKKNKEKQESEIEFIPWGLYRSLIPSKNRKEKQGKTRIRN